MSPRSPVAFLAALVLVLTGCTSGESTPPTGTNVASDIRDVRVKIPFDRPLHGSRQRGAQWRTSGLVPVQVKARPFTRGVLLEGQLEQPVDKDGIREFERRDEFYFHPVAIAQYALARLDEANQSGSAEALESAELNAAKLLDIADTHDGGLYFAYPFDFSLGGRPKHTIHAPWWSAMAQGEALSLFVRLFEATGDKKWREAADRTFVTLDDVGPRDDPWSVFIDRRHYLWFEEYAGDTKPLIVLNGHMFAMFGLWDYHRLTGSKKAARLFDAGATTLREYLPLFREEGEASYYCIRLPLCSQRSWQSEKYHGIVTRQMRYIGDMTDERWFNREANRYQRDFAGWPLPPTDE